MLAAELPKVTDWMQGWGSLLGVGVSTLAVIITGLLLRHEMRARREDKEDAEAAQARLVCGDLRRPTKENDLVVSVGLGVTNFSSAPIHDVYVSIEDSRQRKTRTFAGEMMMHKRGIAPNGDAVQPHVFKWQPPLSDLQLFAEVTIEFLDASGLTWRKVGNKPPVRLRPRIKPRTTISSVLWDYIWPISDPARWVRDQVAAVQSTVTAHMTHSIMRRHAKADLDRI